MTNGEITAGRIPSRVSVNPNFAPASAMTRSATAHSPMPPPSAAPWTRAIDRDRARVDRLEHLGHRHRVLLVALDVERHRRAHPVDVGAGAERRTVAGEDDGPQLGRRLAGEAGERRPELGDQRGVERVVDLGAGERDAGDGAGRSGPLDPEHPAHGASPGVYLRFRRRQISWSPIASRFARGHRPGVGRGHGPRAAGHRRRERPMRDQRPLDAATARLREHATVARARRRDGGSASRRRPRRDRRARRGPGGSRGPGRRAARTRRHASAIGGSTSNAAMYVSTHACSSSGPSTGRMTSPATAGRRHGEKLLDRGGVDADATIRHGPGSARIRRRRRASPWSRWRDRGRGPGRSRSGPSAGRTPG